VASLTEWMRFLLIASIDPDSRELLSLTEETRKHLVKMVEGVSTEHLLSLLSMIADAENNIKRASHQRYLLETVILRMANVRAIARVSDIVEMLKSPGSDSGRGRGPGGAGPAGGKTPASGSGGKARGGAGQGSHGRGPKGRSGDGRGASSADAGPAAPGRAAGLSAAVAFEGVQPGGIIQCWQDVLDNIRETKIGLASVLDLCEPPRLSEGVYWIEAPSSFHESQVRKGQNLRILTEHVQKLTNTPVTIKTRVKPKEETAPHYGSPAGREVGVSLGAAPHADRQETGPEPEAPVQPGAADIAAVIEKDPVIRALVENLGGKVVGIRRRKAGAKRHDQA
jgi:hypothetical protein